MKKFAYLFVGLLSFGAFAGDQEKEAIPDLKLTSKVQFVEVDDQSFKPGSGFQDGTNIKQIKREKNKLDQRLQDDHRFLYLTNTNQTKAIQGVLSFRAGDGTKKRNAAKFFVKPGATVYLGQYHKSLSFKPYKAHYVTEAKLVAMNKQKSEK